MANVHTESIPAPPPYEDISTHGPRDAFIPSHSPPPAYDSEEVQYGGRRGNQVRPRDAARGRPNPSAPFLGSTETMVITIDGQGANGSGDETESETSCLLAGNGERRTEQRILGRSRRYGSVDNPLYEQFMRRYPATNSAIHRLVMFHVLVTFLLLVIGVLCVAMPSSFTLYFGAVHLACALLFLLCSIVLLCRSNETVASFGNKLTTLCAVLSVLALIASAFSTAQESTYFLTCYELPSEQLKCPDGIINPPFDFKNIMYRVIIQGSGCFLFVIFSITFSIQMCHMDRFMVFRRVINRV